MSPTALPPLPPEYSEASAASPSAQVAFEQLVADAFLVRERSRQLTNHVMLAMDLLVNEDTKVV